MSTGKAERWVISLAIACALVSWMTAGLLLNSHPPTELGIYVASMASTAMGIWAVTFLLRRGGRACIWIVLITGAPLTFGACAVIRCVVWWLRLA